MGESSREMRFSLSSPPGGAQKGRAPDTSRPITNTDEANSSSDFNQWLHAMKMVARLPGGMPPEFRRKLWLALADKYLKSKNVDWQKEEVKCFSEQWREDDEELGIQIVKDLHRTGSSLCSGPAGTLNQAKLKRILLGYARYNPEVGYCQGFNMLGALILQVMDKEEIESIKVMIYLVEGILPSGYFSGSLGGLQADMAVFRELMTSKLPKLAKHLQKLQGPVENAFEPPLTNVFTMQWFLTMFCTCLPMTCVLRVWDLVLIEGSDVLLRTALVLWSLLEERILNARTADDFYCQMGSFSSELLNGHLVDSNGLIEKVVDLGPIPDLQKLRDKHLYNITPFRDKKGLQLYYSDEDGDSDEDSRMAVATAWGLRLSRRGSAGLNSKPENKDRIALDISLLKKQYDRLRERQRQAHIILTSAVARQGSNPNQSPIQMNQLLMGRNAIVTNNGRRLGPPQGAIPPARKPSLPTAKPPKLGQTKKLLSGETLHWRDTDLSKRRRASLKWKDIRSDSSLGGQDDRPSALIESAPSSRSSSSEPKSKRATLKASRQRSDSSSYSEESDGNSSTSTSLCDEDEVGDHAVSSLEGSPMKKSRSSKKHSEVSKQKSLEDVLNSNDSKPTIDNQIPFIQLTTIESPVLNANKTDIDSLKYDKEDSETESNRLDYAGFVDEYSWPDFNETTSTGALEDPTIEATSDEGDFLSLSNVITSTSQLSPMPDITTYINNSTISPLRTPISAFDYANLVESIEDSKKFDVNEEGVTNEYFERVNIVERPTKLDLLYSLNEEDSIRNAYVSCEPSPVEDVEQSSQEKTDHEAHIETEDIAQPAKPSTEEMERKMKVLLEYSNQSSLSFIAEAKHEISSGMFKEVEFDANSLKYQPSTLVPLKKPHLLKTALDDSGTMEHVIAVPVSPMSLSSSADEKNLLQDLNQKRDSAAETSHVDSGILPENLEMEVQQDFEKKNETFEWKDQTQEDEKPSSKNVIPSTEDLETRFRALEMNFSERKVSGKSDIGDSPKFRPPPPEHPDDDLSEVSKTSTLEVTGGPIIPKDIPDNPSLEKKHQEESEWELHQENATSDYKSEVTTSKESEPLDEEIKKGFPLTFEEGSMSGDDGYTTNRETLNKVMPEEKNAATKGPIGDISSVLPFEDPSTKDWTTKNPDNEDRDHYSNSQSKSDVQPSTSKKITVDLQPLPSDDFKASDDPYDHDSRDTGKEKEPHKEEEIQLSSYPRTSMKDETNESDRYEHGDHNELESHSGFLDKEEDTIPGKDFRRSFPSKWSSNEDGTIENNLRDHISHPQFEKAMETPVNEEKRRSHEKLHPSSPSNVNIVKEENKLSVTHCQAESHDDEEKGVTKDENGRISSDKTKTKEETSDSDHPDLETPFQDPQTNNLTMKWETYPTEETRSSLSSTKYETIDDMSVNNKKLISDSIYPETFRSTTEQDVIDERRKPGFSSSQNEKCHVSSIEESSSQNFKPIQDQRNADQIESSTQLKSADANSPKNEIKSNKTSLKDELYPWSPSKEVFPKKDKTYEDHKFDVSDYQYQSAKDQSTDEHRSDQKSYPRLSISEEEEKLSSSLPVEESCNDKVQKDIQSEFTRSPVKELPSNWKPSDLESRIDDHDITKYQFQTAVDQTSKMDQHKMLAQSNTEAPCAQPSTNNNTANDQSITDRETITNKSATKEILPDENLASKKLANEGTESTSEKAENPQARDKSENVTGRQRDSLTCYDNYKEKISSEAQDGIANESNSIHKQILPTYSLSYTHDNFGKQATFNVLSQSSETSNLLNRLKPVQSSVKSSEIEEVQSILTPSNVKSSKTLQPSDDFKLSQSSPESSTKKTELKQLVVNTKTSEQLTQSSQNTNQTTGIMEKSTDLRPSENSVESLGAVERSVSLKLSQTPLKSSNILERSDDVKPFQGIANTNPTVQNLEIVASTTASQRSPLNDKQVDTIVLKVGVTDKEYQKLNISLSLQMESAFERVEHENIKKLNTDNLSQSMVKSADHDAITPRGNELVEPSKSSRSIALSMQKSSYTENYFEDKLTTESDCVQRDSLQPVEGSVTTFFEDKSESKQSIEKEIQNKGRSMETSSAPTEKIKTSDSDDSTQAFEKGTSDKAIGDCQNILSSRKPPQDISEIEQKDLSPKVVTLDDVLPMKLKVDPPSQIISRSETKKPVSQGTTTKVIPSTADLEHRFQELERQLSSKSLSAKTTAPQQEDSKTIESSTSVSKPSIILPIKDEPTHSHSPKQNSPNGNEHFAVEEQTTSVRKRIPSTEDLETRFQALEIQKSLKSPTSNLLSPSKIQEDFLNSIPDFDNKRKTEIPSTEALEDRFQAFEQSKKNESAKLKKLDKNSTQIECSKKEPSNDMCTKTPKESSLETSTDLLPEDHKQATIDKPKLLSKEERAAENSSSSLDACTKPNETPTICVLRKEKELRKVPSAKDLEARFEALEKRKSFTETSTKTKVNQTESNSLNPLESLKFRDKNDKKVASTEDLLSRLDALEERMSITENCIKSKMTTKTSDKELKVVPSTVDLESRFEALEKRKSFHEMSTKPNVLIAAEEKKYSSKENLTDKGPIKSLKDENEDKQPGVKKLPSTQDLETRFAALEHQKSKTGKSILSDKETEHFKDRTPSSKDMSTESVLKIKPTQSRTARFDLLEQQQSKIFLQEKSKAELVSKLPSTKDLESRYEALEQQKVKMDSCSKLKDFRPKSSSDIFEKTPSPSFSSLLSKSDELQRKHLYKAPMPFEKSPERISTKSRELLREQSSLSKVPSTHDLEKRFNELQISTKKGDEIVEPEEVLNEADSSMEIAGHHKRRDLYKLESQSDETLTASDPRYTEFDAKTESRPTSCPEYRDPFDSNIVTTDRVLKIIEENSKILHRILKKTLADNGADDGKAQPVNSGFTDSLLALGNIFPRNDDNISPSRIKSQSRVRSTITFRSDDSITDRLASIKSTIKSIDTLCEEKTFRKDKCQRYIDSLFTARPNASTSPLPPAKPLIRVDDFESKSPSRSQERVHMRELRKETSPRRRRNEDREEHESRVRREMMPNSLDAPSEFSCSLENIAKVDSEVDSINQDKQVETQLERPLSPYYAPGYDLNKRSITPVVYIPTKLEIRHTTFTSTFYDRYLTEKHIERAFPRGKKSPVSPTAMTKSYLDISSYASPELDRSSKSAENSPARHKGGLSPNETVPTSGNNKRSLISTLEVAQKDLQIRSCDNILLQLRSSALKTDIVPSIMVYNPLPTKIRKPPELGISLGLYKDYGSDAASKS